MTKALAAFFAILMGLLIPATAHAREWQSANGEVYDVYMARNVENADDAFAIMALYLDTENATLTSVVDLADSIFEEALIHFAAQNGHTAAVIRFSPPVDVPEGELPPVTADIRYETLDGEIWERMNYPEVPVGESRLFPSSPTAEITLSSGEVLDLEPATILFANDSERRQLHVRTIYPFFVIDDANGSRVMQMIWDEVVRPIARQEGINNVSISIFPEPRTSRFDYRLSYVEVFSKETWEGWPRYAAMTEAGN